VLKLEAPCHVVVIGIAITDVNRLFVYSPGLYICPKWWLNVVERVKEWVGEEGTEHCTRRVLDGALTRLSCFSLWVPKFIV